MVSIIMSVYNGEKYLEECLDSVFDQSYKNFELILINDGSTDNSINIINRYREKYSNIVYLEQENQGISNARNLGLEIATGKYVLYIDSDDYIDKKMIQLMIDKIESDKSDMVIIGHREFYESLNGQVADVKLQVDENRIYSGLEVSDMMLQCEVTGVLWNKLYQREYLKRMEFNFESGRYTQDWYPVFNYVSNLKKISFINLPLYTYRINSASITSKKGEKRIEDYKHAVDKILSYVNENINEFNLNSINKFKAITSNTLLSLIDSTCNVTKENFYLKTRYFKIDELTPSVSEIVNLDGVGYRTKLYLIMFNIKLYTVVSKLEKIIRKAIRR